MLRWQLMPTGVDDMNEQECLCKRSTALVAETFVVFRQDNPIELCGYR